jgi:hypothetical protein
MFVTALSDLPIASAMQAIGKLGVDLHRDPVGRRLVAGLYTRVLYSRRNRPSPEEAPGRVPPLPPRRDWHKPQVSTGPDGRPYITAAAPAQLVKLLECSAGLIVSWQSSLRTARVNGVLADLIPQLRNCSPADLVVATACLGRLDFSKGARAAYLVALEDAVTPHLISRLNSSQIVNLLAGLARLYTTPLNIPESVVRPLSIVSDPMTFTPDCSQIVAHGMLESA